MCHRQLWRVEAQSHVPFDYGNHFNHGAEQQESGSRQEVTQLTAGRKHLHMQLIDYYSPETGFETWHHVPVAPFTAELCSHTLYS